MKKISKFLIFIIIISIIIFFPKAIRPDCLHTYRIGYWFQPCHTYYWVCEDCSDCRMSCLELAVCIVCIGDNGVEYVLPQARDEFCWEPIII